MPAQYQHHAHLVGSVLLALIGGVPAPRGVDSYQHRDPAIYLKPYVKAGDVLSDITYRVISVQAPGFSESVAQVPATATFTFADTTADHISWRVSARYDGKMSIKDEAGEYRNDGRTECFRGQCNITVDASGPFVNPTFWGNPRLPLHRGMHWTVTLDKPWELGPPGQQTVTVLSVDSTNGIVVMKREGSGIGPAEGASDSLVLKRDGNQYHVKVKYDDAHWIGQAVFQHGIAISDELLCNTSLELSSPEVGTLKADERQYISLLQHPGVIAN